MPTEKDLWPELEKIGEDTVRTRFATDAYGTVGNKRALVEEWLRRKDQERKDASTAEQASIARDAAEISAREAGTANHTAKIAIAIAAIAIIVSIASLFSK